MTDEHYKEAFATARQELERLLEQREEIDKRISQLKQSIVALAPLAEEQDLLAEIVKGWMGEMGITDAIREVLKSSGDALTAMEVKDQLVRTGTSLRDYKNPLASIHAVLKRLVESDEAIADTDTEGNATYQWIRRFPRLSTAQKANARIESALGLNKGIAPPRMTPPPHIPRVPMKKT